MSKSKGSKKVVVTTSKDIKPTQSKISKNQKVEKKASTLSFGKKNYTLMLIGIALIFFGLILMSGGSMPSPDVWDDSIIYSTRRTLIAPIVIISGLIVEIYAIFK